MIRRPPRSTLFPTRRSSDLEPEKLIATAVYGAKIFAVEGSYDDCSRLCVELSFELDRKSTRLNSSHLVISYAVFCLKKKKTIKPRSLFHYRSASVHDSRDSK